MRPPFGGSSPARVSVIVVVSRTKVIVEILKMGQSDKQFPAIIPFPTGGRGQSVFSRDSPRLTTTFAWALFCG